MDRSRRAAEVVQAVAGEAVAPEVAVLGNPDRPPQLAVVEVVVRMVG